MIIPSAPALEPVALTGPASRRTQAWEIAIVLALSLGASAAYAIVSLIGALTQGPLSEQRTALNRSVTPRPWLDLTYQLLGIATELAPVALVILLLTLLPAARVAARGDGSPAAVQLGLSPVRPWRDLAWGAVLAACIGLPGLAIYAAGRALGATMDVIPAALDTHWWTIPVLVLQATKNAVIEEVIAVGYLVRRLEQRGWRSSSITATSAILRGSYHLYQGIGPGLANVAMGVVFARWFQRTGRTGPLIVAHTLLDVVAFVGYVLLKDHLGPILGR